MTSSPPFNEAKSVCDTCRAVLQAYAIAADGSVLGVTAQRLETRAAQGCRLCALFLGTSSGGSLGDTRALARGFYEEHEHRGEIVVTYSKQNVYSSYRSLNALIAVGSDGPDAEKGLASTLAVLYAPGSPMHSLRSVEGAADKSSIGSCAH